MKAFFFLTAFLLAFGASISEEADVPDELEPGLLCGLIQTVETFISNGIKNKFGEQCLMTMAGFVDACQNDIHAEAQAMAPIACQMASGMITEKLKNLPPFLKKFFGGEGGFSKMCTPFMQQFMERFLTNTCAKVEGLTAEQICDGAFTGIVKAFTKNLEDRFCM